MTATNDFLTKYYDSWSTGSGFVLDRNWFTDDFQFFGPLNEISGPDDFLVMCKERAPKITRLEFKGKFESKDNPNQLCAFFEFFCEAPMPSKTTCAEFFTFENDKIKKIELVYDATDWPPVS